MSHQNSVKFSVGAIALLAVALSPSVSAQIVNDIPMAKTYPTVEAALAASRVETTQLRTGDYGTPIQNIEIFENPVPDAYGSTIQSNAPMYTYESPTTTYRSAFAPNSGSFSQGYTVLAGDTLYSIARRHGVKVSELMNANNLSSSSISVGQALTLPIQTEGTQTFVQAQPEYAAPVVQAAQVQRRVLAIPGQNVYAVLPGDTLYSIARQSCVSAGQISEASGISIASTLSPGQRLTLPAGNCSQ